MSTQKTKDDLILEKAKELQIFLLEQKITLWPAQDQFKTYQDNPSFEHNHSFWKVIFPSFYEEAKKILDADVNGGEQISIKFLNHFTDTIKAHAQQDSALKNERAGFQISLMTQLIKTYSRDILDLIDSPIYQKIYLNKELHIPELSSHGDKSSNKLGNSKGKI